MCEYTNPVVNSLFKLLWRPTEQIDRSKIGNGIFQSHPFSKTYFNSLDIGQNFRRLLEETTQSSWDQKLDGVTSVGPPEADSTIPTGSGRGIYPSPGTSVIMSFFRLRHHPHFLRDIFKFTGRDFLVILHK